MTDTQLINIIESCIRRETDAFRQLYNHLEPRIFAYLSYRTPTREIAIDLTQDVFVELYSSLAKYNFLSVGQFYAFVFKIVRRQLAQHYTNKHTCSFKDRSDVQEDSLPEETLVITEQVAIRQALETLDERTREIIVLHHWSRYSFVEIAEILGMKEGAVRTRHHRGLGSLASLLVSVSIS